MEIWTLEITGDKEICFTHFSLFFGGSDTVLAELHDFIRVPFSKNQFTVATSSFQTNQSFLECNSELLFRKRIPLAVFLDRTSEYNIRIINSLLYS